MAETKSKTEYYKFTGKAAWAKVYEPDEFRGTQNWKINVYLDKEGLELYKKAGIQGKVKEDENGTYVVFKRPVTKLIKGQQQIFSAPRILDKDGKTIVEYKKNADNTGFDRVGDVVLIGNGSVVTCTVSVYPTSMGNGQRLESVQIVDLIEYVSSSTDGNSFSDTIVVAGAAPAGNVKTPW